MGSQLVIRFTCYLLYFNIVQHLLPLNIVHACTLQDLLPLGQWAAQSQQQQVKSSPITIADQVKSSMKETEPQKLTLLMSKLLTSLPNGIRAGSPDSLKLYWVIPERWKLAKNSCLKLEEFCGG